MENELTNFNKNIRPTESLQPPECKLERDFIRGLQLIANDQPGYRYNPQFMSLASGLNFPDLKNYLHYTGDYIEQYITENQKTILNFNDLINIFSDTQHFIETPKEPIEVFACVLNPIEISSVEENRYNGLYKGRKLIEVSSLYNPFPSKIEKGSIVVAHYATIVGLIDANRARLIVDHQKKDELLQREYSKIERVDYGKDLNNIFGWTEEHFKTRNY